MDDLDGLVTRCLVKPTRTRLAYGPWVPVSQSHECEENGKEGGALPARVRPLHPLTHTLVRLARVSRHSSRDVTWIMRFRCSKLRRKHDGCQRRRLAKLVDRLHGVFLLL